MKEKSIGSNTASLSAQQCRAVNVLNDWTALVQKHFGQDVEANRVRFFLLAAASSDPLDLQNVGEALKLSQAATSRNFYALSDGRKDEPGLDYVKGVVDYNDRRRRLVALTPKGINVATELLDFFKRKGEYLVGDLAMA
jgi:DNA-binding MarR family transcriptional regulator